MDREEFESVLKIADDDGRLLKTLLSDLASANQLDRTVFGIDIYEYSKMDALKQFTVPFIVDQLFENTLARLKSQETAFFRDEFLVEIRRSRIDTGDGFFLILMNPLHALLFLCHFSIELELFKTRYRARTLMRSMNDYVIRYAISKGDVFIYSGKYYGDAIIRCARIMAKDRLNRCLIDNATYFWFYDNASGLESIQDAGLHNIFGIEELQAVKEGKSDIFLTGPMVFSSFKSIVVNKIGRISVKNDTFDIYNVFLQIGMRVGEALMNSFPIVASAGTINMHGLNEG
jgi:hypothetical protein